MNVCGVACEEHSSFAVGSRLSGAVGPGRGYVQRSHGHLDTGHAPQDRFCVLARERLVAIEGAAVELGDAERPGLPLRVHARRRVVTTEREWFFEVDLKGISRELGL